VKPSCAVTLLLLSALEAAAAAPAITPGFAPGADGVRIHYRAAGAADAAHTLLLVPGWRISSLIFRHQLEYFAAHGFRVVAIDSRSQGGSTVVESHNAPEDRAADLQSVIAALHFTRLVLVGWSQGVQDTAAYVGRFGTSAVAGFVLVDSPVSAGPEDITANPQFIGQVLRGMARYSNDPRGYSDGLMHAIISTTIPAATYAQLVDESMKTPPDVGLAMLAQDLLTTDRRAALAAFDKPVLVVASAKSPLLEQTRRMATALPHARLAVIEHAAHAVFFDQPDEFDRRLQAFVAGLDADRR
jgi:non-heme chloroperoxidase